ncbi:MAG: nuclear transport factor 2 family protein [Armatimonadota bacterium]|nr:nuclear transport factor 2 family protein [Armatimonadota bacterium]MDR7409424.1 nuclear transport factor 2 family protein [Armatimonadota bacterium]
MGQLEMTGKASTNRAARTVLEFLRLVEERLLDDAARLLGSGASIIFPGGRIFRRLEEMVEFASARYCSVRKHVEEVDVVSGEDHDVVYVKGTLKGVSVRGVRFEGVRFVDRFVVRGERIVRQEVWNDLAESEALIQDLGTRQPTREV